jgi:hypothetical protein
MFMEKIAIENKTKMPMYVAGQMIPPGEFRHFNEDQVPAEFRPAKDETPESEPEDPIAALSKLSVKSIVEKFPELSDADLERLGDLEQLKGDEARTTLLGGITSEMFHRADQKAAG